MSVLQAADGPGWSDFPATLRQENDDYLASLQKIRKATNGKRSTTFLIDIDPVLATGELSGSKSGTGD